MVLGKVPEEEWEEGEFCGAPPDVVVCEVEDHEVVDGEDVRCVDGCGGGHGVMGWDDGTGTEMRSFSVGYRKTGNL